MLDGWERNRYFLCENGVIANEGSGSAFDQDQWENDSYYYTTESDEDTENAEIISKEQSDAIKGKYVYEHTAFIPKNL